MNTALEAVGINKRFGAVSAASNVNVSLGINEVLGVIGANGAIVYANDHQPLVPMVPIAPMDNYVIGTNERQWHHSNGTIGDSDAQ